MTGLAAVAFWLMTAVVVSGMLYFMYSIHKENKTLLGILTAPKPPAPAAIPPGTPPPYLSYADTIKNLNLVTTNTFQRVFVTEILPSIMDSDGQIKMLCPKDTDYVKFVQIISIQTMEQLPHYLKKSVGFYFDIKDFNNPDPVAIGTLSKYVAAKAKALLDNKIIDNIAGLETTGPSAMAYVKNVKAAGKAAKNEKTLPGDAAHPTEM